MIKYLSTLLVGFSIIGCTMQQSFDGYKKVKSTKMDVVGSEITELVHEKSGATVVLMNNQDQARSFMVGFRTPPYDDSGLFHIFEHAVLAGSRLYPSKSNFFHLANSTVASFINAMTGSVYTLYPFVTRSQSDFDNLLSAYMDAVFFPNVIQDPRIIKREGWRFETDPKEKKLKINGIVLSEMKGAFSNPMRSLYFHTSRNLLNETPYSYSSGGLPDKIAGLTFEQIRDAHKKYYHPQNSVIFLYGKIDYKKALKTIDKQFLSNFTKDPNYQRPAIPLQKNFDYPTPLVKKTYPGSRGPNKDYLAKAYVLGNNFSPVEQTAIEVLMTAFSENEASPLKLRVTKEGLARSSGIMTGGSKDNMMAVYFEGTQVSNKAAVEKVINQELTKVASEGMDPQLVEAVLNRYEFYFKESNSNGSHRGLRMASIVLNNWLYQDEPLEKALDFVSHFKEVRKLIGDQNFIKTTFQKYLVDNTSTRWIAMEPDPEFSKKFNAGLEERAKKALEVKSFEEYQKEDEKYKQWVAAKESEEILQKTPVLDIADVKDVESPVPYDKVKIGETEVLQFPADSSGISYMTLYFDLKRVDEEDLKKLRTLRFLLTKVDTQNKTYQDLSKEIGSFIGGLGFSINSYRSVKEDSYRPVMTVNLRFLNNNLDKSFELLKEVTKGSKFTSKDRVANLLAEMKTYLTSSIANRAPGLSMLAATRDLSVDGKFLFEVNGGSFEEFVKGADYNADKLMPDMAKILSEVFNQESLFYAALTTDKNSMNQLMGSLKAYKEALPNSAKPQNRWAFNQQKKYNAFAIPGEVQYVSEATSYKSQGLDYSGSLAVFSRYLNNNYMIPKLREQAGAYGGRSNFTRSGLFSMSTYRDPNLQKSFSIFSQASQYMTEKKLSREQLRPAILGSLKPYYSDKSVEGQRNHLARLFLTDQTWDDYLKTKKEIINTTPDTIMKIGEVLQKALSQSKKGVAGNSNKLKNEAPFLDKRLEL